MMPLSQQRFDDLPAGVVGIGDEDNLTLTAHRN
jgi:hypothetical protein